MTELKRKIERERVTRNNSNIEASMKGEAGAEKETMAERETGRRKGDTMGAKKEGIEEQ